MKQIKAILKEKINLDELKDFTKKGRTTHITNAKNNNTVFKHDVLKLRFAKIKAYAEQNNLDEVLKIFSENVTDIELAQYTGNSREAIWIARDKYEKGKRAYAYMYHLMCYQLNKLNKLLV